MTRHLTETATALAGVLFFTVASAAGEPAATAPEPERAPIAPPAGLPVGAIVAFMPRAGGAYRDMAGLKRWLEARGWALCDGSNGTPDLGHRMLLGTTDLATAGQRLGSREHDHRVRGETDSPVRRNRSTPTGRLNLRQIPDEQHRHRLDVTSAKAEHLPLSLRVLFIMKVR